MIDKIIKVGKTDMGRQRTNNEDAFVCEQLDDASVLAIAIDGVGGYEGGEVAAAIAQIEIPKYMHDFRNGEQLELLKQAVVNANNIIFERRQKDEKRANMSCVLTAAIINKDQKQISMVHVGDTRLYQYHKGVLQKLSHDHSLVGYREEVGDLTETEAMHHPQRNVISRDVGSEKHEVEDRDFIESATYPLLPNSILLFCSDGLTDLVTSQQITTILRKQLPIEQKAQELIDAANTAGGKDNITVVLVEYQAEEPTEPNLKSDVRIEQGIDNNLPTPQPTKNKNPILKYVIIAVIFIIGIVVAIYGVRRYWQYKNAQIYEQIREESLIERELIIKENAQLKKIINHKDSIISTQQWMIDSLMQR